MKCTKSDNFLNIFNCSEKFQKGRPLILSAWPVFCKLFCLITLQASANLPRQKKQKNSSKPCLIHEKNNAKVMLFFHLAFFAFWSQFGEALGSKKGTKPPSGHQNIRKQAFLRCLKHDDCPKWCLGGPPNRFLRPLASIWDGLNSIFSRFGVFFSACFLTFSHEFPISTSSQIIVFRISIFLTSSACPNKAEKLNNQALVMFLVARCIKI